MCSGLGGEEASHRRGRHSGSQRAFARRVGARRQASHAGKDAGFEAAPLRFQPAADVEHQAHEAGCQYILYTDVVDVHKTTGTQVVNAVTPTKKRDIWEAEVEFRIFAVDKVQPLMATSVTGRNAKSHPQKGPAMAAPAPTPASTKSVSEASVLTEATPMEETGRQKKHKSVAVASALDREVKMVRDSGRQAEQQGKAP